MPHDDLHTLFALHRRTALSWAGPRARGPAEGEAARAFLAETGGLTPWRRPSVRAFTPDTPPREVLVQLVRDAYGESGGRRNVPSSGAQYGLVPYAVPRQGGAVLRATRDGRLVEAGGVPASEKEVSAAFFGQLQGNPWLVVLGADPRPYAARYGPRGYRYLLLEAGHVSQELIRGAGAAGLGACPLGAFDDDGLARLLGGDLTGLLPVLAVALGIPRGRT